MAKYRVLELSCENDEGEKRDFFVPQAWRWWFPLWLPIFFEAHQGGGLCAARYDSMDDALNAISKHGSRFPLTKCVVHGVKPGEWR